MGCRTLLLDEPTSDLDEASRAELLAALRDLHRAGHTILMTSTAWRAWRGWLTGWSRWRKEGSVSNGTFPMEKPLSRR